MCPLTSWGECRAAPAGGRLGTLFVDTMFPAPDCAQVGH
jgi:hypothetical protein